MDPQPDPGKMRYNGDYWEMHIGYPLGHDIPQWEYGSVGDTLYVKEQWRVGDWREVEGKVVIDYYKGMRKEWLDVPCSDRELFFKDLCKDLVTCGSMTGCGGLYHREPGESPLPWKPSKDMPEWASRSFITITSIEIYPIDYVKMEGIGIYPDVPCDSSWVWDIGFRLLEGIR